MNTQELDLTLCDREPIHIPGSIQPHGLMLLVAPDSLTVMHAAGDVEGRLGCAPHGVSLAEILGPSAAAQAERTIGSGGRGVLSEISPRSGKERFDATFHVSGDWLIVELEPVFEGVDARSLLPQIEAAAAAFERAPTLVRLCELAAVEFRRLSGYDRVMIYRFLDDDAGVVIAEDTAPGQHSFLNHHFPSSDIPKQARALYVRNPVRVIPDVHYIAAPLDPPLTSEEPLDMSDCILRSVSPVHLQYLKNMQVGASASISIVKDGALWGLIACHNETPRPIAADARASCRALAGGLSRQIKAREEAEEYRERVRLRSFEDDIVALLSREGSLDQAISNHLPELMRVLGADGVAVIRGDELLCGGRCIPQAELRKLASWAIERSTETVFATHRLSDFYALPEEHRPLAAGILAITLSVSEPWMVMWFRAELVEVVNWAGNPHKNVTISEGGALTPRTSFEMWSETVRGHSRRWTIPEIEAAGRLRSAVIEVWQNRRVRDLNRQLLITLEQKDLLIQQKEFLIGEVNHRVQNSLQLVASFLALQARSSDNPILHAALDEARSRLSAVSLVHRRLYRADQLEAVDAGRYTEELLRDLLASMGDDWARQVVEDLDSISLPTDRAVGLGLVLTELVINANKYAYGGEAGPLHISLTKERARFRLTVADEGRGRTSSRKGFGSRMMDALVGQLGGTLTFEDNKPGTRAILVAPIEMY